MGKHDTSKLPIKPELAITLKVFIHCEGCSRKVKRIIKCVDGVDSVSIELESGKVTVTGCVDSKAVLQSLQKAGKHAEIWHNAGKAVNLQNQAANKPANNKMNTRIKSDSLPRAIDNY